MEGLRERGGGGGRGNAGEWSDVTVTRDVTGAIRFRGRVSSVAWGAILMQINSAEMKLLCPSASPLSPSPFPTSTDLCIIMPTYCTRPFVNSLTGWFEGAFSFNAQVCLTARFERSNWHTIQLPHRGSSSGGYDGHWWLLRPVWMTQSMVEYQTGRLGAPSWRDSNTELIGSWIGHSDRVRTRWAWLVAGWPATTVELGARWLVLVGWWLGRANRLIQSEVKLETGFIRADD